MSVIGRWVRPTYRDLERSFLIVVKQAQIDGIRDLHRFFVSRHERRLHEKTFQRSCVKLWLQEDEDELKRNEMYHNLKRKRGGG